MPIPAWLTATARVCVVLAILLFVAALAFSAPVGPLDDWLVTASYATFFGLPAVVPLWFRVTFPRIVLFGVAVVLWTGMLTLPALAAPTPVLLLVTWAYVAWQERGRGDVELHDSP